jgi:hypothetical protein
MLRASYTVTIGGGLVASSAIWGVFATPTLELDCAPGEQVDVFTRVAGNGARLPAAKSDPSARLPGYVAGGRFLGARLAGALEGSLERLRRAHLTSGHLLGSSFLLSSVGHGPNGDACPRRSTRRPRRGRRCARTRRPRLSVRNVVPTLTSNKRQGLSLDGRC